MGHRSNSRMHGGKWCSCLGVFHQSGIRVGVDGPVHAQTTEYHAVGTQLTGNVNIAFHPFYFQRAIEEVASAGTYDDMQTGMCEHSACHAYLPIRWRGAAFGYSCA